MLCTPENTDIPVPAVCGSHHIFRSMGYRLVIIFRPMISITSGLTCVAAYIAPECENGRRNGFASTPYPLETARRVDHESNAAAPEEASISAYQVFFSRSETSSGLKAGLAGLTARGALPGAIGSAVAPGATPAAFAFAAISASVLIFGSGTEGNAFEREESFAAST